MAWSGDLHHHAHLTIHRIVYSLSQFWDEEREMIQKGRL